LNFNIDLEEAVGLNYDDFLYSKKRYLVCKGSRGSKKSCTTALKVIYFMMKYSRFKPNTLVVRKYFNTHKNSTRAQLIWAIDKLGVRSLWRIPRGENTLTFLPTGQQILFRGMDDPQSITSITVSEGYLCWVWIEECFQITKEEDFNKLDMSIRGKLPPELFHQFILTFNPWSDRHWLKSKFFDNPDENTLAITTNYMMNEFLSESDIRLYEIMKERYPKRYRIEGLGEWGIAEGLIYENWHEEDFDINELLEKNRNKKDNRGLPAFVSVHGMDFGYNDPTFFVGAYADKKEYKIYIFYEYCEVQMENRKIAAKLIEDGFEDAIIRADSEDPRTINELRLLGLNGIRGAKKGAGSVVGGIQKLQDYELIVSPKCPHMMEALSNYAWKKDRMTDKIMNEPEHDFSHGPDALRYGCEDLSKFGIQV
jgi:phage terminase large subunit